MTQDIIRASSDKFRANYFTEGASRFYYDGKYIDIETGEPCKIEEIPNLDNIVSLQVGEKNGMLYEGSLLFPLKDKAFYYPLSYSLKGRVTEESSYPNVNFGSNSCTISNITADSLLDINLSNKGIFNIEGCCTFEDIHKAKVSDIKKEFFQKAYLRHTTDSGVIKYSELPITTFRSNPFASPIDVLIRPLFVRYTDAAFFEVPLEFEHTGDWCVSFYVKGINILVDNIKLNDAPLTEGILKKKSTVAKLQSESNTGIEVLQDHLADDEWGRVSVTFNVSDISSKKYLYIGFIPKPSSISTSRAKSTSYSIELSAFKVEDAAYPSAYITVPKIGKENPFVRYPALFDFDRLKDAYSTGVILWENDSWVIYYKRKFDETLSKKGTFRDSLGSFYWGYSEGKISCTPGANVVTPENFEIMFNIWENVFIYRQEGNINVLVVPEKLPKEESAGSYKISIPENSVDLKQNIFGKTNFNLCLGGHYNIIRLRTYNGYYRDLMFSVGIDNKEEFIKHFRGNRFSLFAKDGRMILQAESIKEGF